MDANQTRFHLLLGQGDWAAAATPQAGDVFAIPGADLEWDNKRKELRLRAEPFYFKAARRDDPPTQDDRRGAAADSYSNWYWISDARDEIRVHWSGEAASSHFWSAADALPPTAARDATFEPCLPPAPPPARRFSGLAVTEDHYLVAGTVQPDGLLVFDLLGGGAPRVLCWPNETKFKPFDIVPRPGGGVWILDREHERFWGLDRTLRVISRDQTTHAFREEETFQPVAGHRRARTCAFPEGVDLGHGSPIEALNPVAIEALSDGSVLILDAPANSVSRVLRYRFGEFLGEVTLDFAAYDFAFAGEELLIATAAGNQAFAYTVGGLEAPLKLDRALKYFPMRRFGGKALVASAGRVFYDFGERWLRLIAQEYQRHATRAMFESKTFDGREPQCVWHRLLLDGCLPPGTDVHVWSRAADSEDEVRVTEWEAEPRLHRRAEGSELPFTPAAAAKDRGTFELLLQKARGRFVQLRLQLMGDGRLTPRLSALRVYYPRFSYLERYLPAVYREDASSASFLDRFLANIEGTNTAIEDRIAAVHMLFDVRSAPADALEWLASWFGIALDPAWDETRRRLFIAHAMEFFQWRGTVRGLKMALRLALEKEADAHIFDPPDSKCRCAGRYRIIERFLTRGTPAVEVGDPSGLEPRPQFVPATGKWKPLDGAEALHARYRAATTGGAFSLVPVAEPEETARRRFAQRELGFLPSDPTEEIAAWKSHARDLDVDLPNDEPRSAELARSWHTFQAVSDPQPYGRQRRMWQQFLVRRYVSLAALNSAHGTHWRDFDAVAYPGAVPSNLARLVDWIEFESHVLPTLAAAHRFTVLLPVTRITAETQADRLRELALVNRIVELEKPAHTVFDVKFFWAHFRVGAARLGSDTVLGRGSRDPALLPHAAVLGESYLSESVVGNALPSALSGRIVIGRERLQKHPHKKP